MADQKIYVVTGANKSIGLAIVKSMCKKFDGVVYLTSRDEGRGKKAVESLKELGLAPIFHQLDIADNESVQRFAKHVKDVHGGVDAIINNAAVLAKLDTTASLGEQAEYTLGINYYGTMNMFKTFFPLLRPHARVVNISSSCGHLSQFPEGDLHKRIGDPNLTEKQIEELLQEFIDFSHSINSHKDAESNRKLYKEAGWPSIVWPAPSYMVSKVVVSAATQLQQKIFDSDPREDLVVNHCDPGWVDTDMTTDNPGPLNPDQASVCPVYLATLPMGTNLKGKYFYSDTTEVDWYGPMLPLPYPVENFEPYH